MKTLELRCACGWVLVFRGRNSDDVVKQIDEAGWQDLPGGKKGWMPGRCPVCIEAWNGVGE